MNPSMAVRTFRDLRVYRMAREGARDIFMLTKCFPKEERYALTDQIRRASRSVHANIAEAWRKRRYPASFVSKLSDSDTEAAEVQSWLDSAMDSGYINEEQYLRFDDRYDHLSAQLYLMMQDANKWCKNASKRSQRDQKK